MKLTVTQSALSRALGFVSKAISSKSPLPVLQNVLLETNGQQLRLAGTNRDLSMQYWICADVDDPGSVTLPFRLLAELTNSLPDEDIKMDLIERSITMRLVCAGTKSNIKGTRGDEFPLLPSIGDTVAAYVVPVIGVDTIDASQLATAIKQATFAASTEQTRLTLTGINLEFTDGEMSLAATDGYRMSQAVIVDSSSKAAGQVLIPATSMIEVGRLCSMATGELSVKFTENAAMFGTDIDDAERAEVSTSLIDAKFPDYKSTIPKAHNTLVEVNRAAFRNAVKVAQLFARDYADRITIDITDNALALTATSAETGDNQTTIECHTEGSPLSTCLNGRYLLNYLDSIDAESITMKFTKPERPVVFEYGHYIHVIMPMATLK